MLNKAYKVDLALDGQDGLTKAKAKQYGLVITDDNMPKMDGLTLVAELRKFSTVPIIFLLSPQTTVNASDARTKGVNGAFIKPLNKQTIQTFLDMVKKLIGA